MAEKNNKSEQQEIKHAVSSPTEESDLEVPSPEGATQFSHENEFAGEPQDKGYEQTGQDQYYGQQMPPPELSQQSYGGMQPSLMAQQEYPTEQVVGGNTQGNPSYDNYPATEYNSYQYQPYQESMSSDVISEISEQVVDEKLSVLRDQLETAVDFKTIAESRINSLNERLARIEKIIDKLQLSVLQKVGDYVNDVSDLKKEMRETQKSFKSIHGKHKRKSHKRKKATP